MPTEQQVLASIIETPGLTDREITTQLVGAETGQQKVNRHARNLAAQGLIMRTNRPNDNKIGNYPLDNPHVPPEEIEPIEAAMTITHLFFNILKTEFMKVAKLAGMELNSDDIEVEILPAPHNRPTLPNGMSAVYIFLHEGTALKVGKVGPNSRARYNEHHYTGNAPSTLFGSIENDPDFIEQEDILPEHIGEWIKEHTTRVNFILGHEINKHVRSLLEVFLICRLNPKYEGG